MEEEWSYLLFDTLINKILNGKQSIQEPIQLYNLEQTKTNNISFLHHLLMYENIDRENLLECLFGIYNQFLEKMENLKRNKNIRNMISMVNDEWYGNCEPNHKLPIDNSFFNNYRDALQGKEKLLVICEDCINSSHKKEGIPYESFLRKESPNDRVLDSGIILSKRILSILQNNLSETEKLLQYFKDFNTSFYIDLAIKHKSLYFQLNNQRDESIPDTIHTIFSNFLNIHNLFYKQIVQHHNSLKELISEIKGSSDNVTQRKKEIELANSILEQRKVIKDLPFNVGDDVLYKGREIVNVFDIDKNVPKDEEPIIYIQFQNGNKRDTPSINLSLIPEDDEDDDEVSLLDDGDEHFLYGGGDKDITGAEKISKKMINSFF